MLSTKLRRHIAIEAAKLMYERTEREYFTAKRKAAARLGVNFKQQPQELPSNREIRDAIQGLARMFEGPARDDTLRDMRLAGLRLMRLLTPFHPRLIGSVVTGHVRRGSDIDIHLFSDGTSAITETLDAHGLRYDVERKRVIKHNTERIFTHVHVHDDYEYELTVYGRDQVNYTFKSSVTGKAIERASIEQLEALIAREHADADLGDEPVGRVDRFLIWSLLLAPLERVKQDPRRHPEGDALYHALQAFEIAREEYPYDQELITAALLHDVGKAIDPHDHVTAGIEALEGTLSERETFLIAHHMDALAYHEQTLGARHRGRLEASEWFEDLMALRDIDNRARRRGAEVCTTDEALAFLQAWAAEES
jgi:hypothetical protein